MAAMAALQSSFTSLSLSSKSPLCPRFSVCPPPPTVSMVRTTKRPFVVQARIKRWERIKCKPNSLPIIPKMHVKVGDTVKVISGRDKGKIGEILKVIKHKSVVVVDDVNVKTKHVKPQKGSDEPGQIITKEAPIHSSNVMLYSKEKEVASRVGHKVLDNGKRVRYLIKTGEVIDNPEKWQREAREEGSTALARTS